MSSVSPHDDSDNGNEVNTTKEGDADMEGVEPTAAGEETARADAAADALAPPSNDDDDVSGTAEPKVANADVRREEVEVDSAVDPPKDSPVTTAAVTATTEPSQDRPTVQPSVTTTTTTETKVPLPLVDLNEWDRAWEEQYERRKRRRVVLRDDALPSRTVGRADDPHRLTAGPCACEGPCHLNDLCPCNHGGLFCGPACRCGPACENCPPYAESRHRALVQAIQQGHRPVVHECCPCAPPCEAAACPCAIMGQRCRHTAPFRACQNPCGAELARPLGHKKQQGPLAMCLRVTPPKNKPTAPSSKAGPAAKKGPAAATATNSATNGVAKSPATSATAAQTTTTVTKPSATSSKSGTKSASKSHSTTHATTPIVPTGIQKAWEIADARADEFFTKHRGAPELEALYDVASNARVHARSELQLNQAERWWWRDITPSAASPGGKPRRRDPDDLECHEPHEGIQVEKDVNKPKLREAIIQVSQETLILRYAAMVLRQKARDLAAQRLKRKRVLSSGGS